MSAAKIFRVGIISGSTRATRSCPQIAAFVLDAIEAHRAATAPSPAVNFDLIDLGAVNLPAFDEPGLPAQIQSSAEYAHAHTRAWSARISAVDAFVFVSPQYNWGMPGGLKNAIDFLYHEWRGKPAAIVTYGGHGGVHSAEQLRTVLGGGLRMRLVEAPVCLTFPSRDVVVRSTRGEDLGLWSRRRQQEQGGDGTGELEGMWADRRGDIGQAWEELVKKLSETE